MQAPNQFQLFVKESTGRNLPLYGSELFDNATAYNPDGSLPAPLNYILGTGDEVRIHVNGLIDYAGTHTIDRNGTINLPKVGNIALAGVALRDLEDFLRANLSKVYANFTVSAILGRQRSIQVYVVGQAKDPGTHQLSSFSTLISALFASGGPSATGSMRNISLLRSGKKISSLDLYDFIARGDKSRDVALQPGDVIVIPPAGPRVAVSGAFDQAAIYELQDPRGSGSNSGSATRLGDILGLGGGVPVLAKVQSALIERIVPGSLPPRQAQRISLDAAGLAQPLRDGDVITLLPISNEIGNAVTLQGAVAEPLRYPWFAGMRVLDLIPERDALITPDYYRSKNLLVQTLAPEPKAGEKISRRIQGLGEQINWEYAVIERLDNKSLTSQLIPFNLGLAILQKDAANNLELKAGDVVTVLSQSDLRLPTERQRRLVRVEGEVAAPGIYEALAGETLPQLVRRIGGLMPQAYVYGLEFSRESVRARQQDSLDQLIRRLDAQYQSAAATLGANLGADRAASAQQLQQQQQAQQKSQLDRLKALKSNGRIALELDTTARTLADLPSLPLEDGDHVTIPAVPSFVAAVGSVNNENVFIHKSGKTVGDIFRSAGLSEDAEPDQAFVLRADGSIVARRDRSGLFGGGFESLAVMPGDTVVVPAQLDRESKYNFITRAVKDWTQILANFGLGAAAIKTLRN